MFMYHTVHVRMCVCVCVVYMYISEEVVTIKEEAYRNSNNRRQSSRKKNTILATEKKGSPIFGCSTELRVVVLRANGGMASRQPPNDRRCVSNK